MYFICQGASYHRASAPLKTPKAEVELQLPEMLQDHPDSSIVVDSRILLHLRHCKRLVLSLISIFPSCEGALWVSISFKEKEIWWL